MGLMCDLCYQTFDSGPLVSGNQCPIRDCHGTLVKIDDPIIGEISHLNRTLSISELPIRTNFCCSGHHFGDIPYVSFYIGDDYIEERTSHYDVQRRILEQFLNEVLIDPVKEANDEIDSNHDFFVKSGVESVGHFNAKINQYQQYLSVMVNYGFSYEPSGDVQAFSISKLKLLNKQHYIFKNLLINIANNIPIN